MNPHTHHHNPECHALLNQLGDYLDGELEAALCAEIEQHLTQCRDCRVLVDTTHKTIRLYQRHHQSQVELSEAITNRLWQALNQKGCLKS